jgi:putative PIN family toxin of toxin-antitoxin system
METRAVLDNNVMLAAGITTSANSPNREIIQRWISGEFAVLVSEDVIAEYAEKLLAAKNARHETDAILTRVLLLSEMVEVRFFHLRHYPEDADDVMFLLCAINGEATHLVSYDPHLLELNVFYDDFKICAPLAFLADLRSKKSKR